MTKLSHMNINRLGEGTTDFPKAGFVMEGEPQFTTWALLDNDISTGVWEATPGHHKVIRDQTLIEAFFILEGEIELSEDGEPQTRCYGAGDLVVIHPGFTGSWRTLATVRKFYCTTAVRQSND